MSFFRAKWLISFLETSCFRSPGEGEAETSLERFLIRLVPFQARSNSASASTLGDRGEPREGQREGVTLVGSVSLG